MCVYALLLYRQANDTFYGIPCEIRNQIKNQTVGKSCMISHYIILYEVRLGNNLRRWVMTLRQILICNLKSKYHKFTNEAL